MKKFIFTTLALFNSSYFSTPLVLIGLSFTLGVGFFIPFESAHAAVLFEQSKTGTPYDIFKDIPGTDSGFVSKLPQYNGVPPIFPGGGIPYSGTAEWLRVKRISGVDCGSRFNIAIVERDGVTLIGGVMGGGVINGEFCDFRMFGPNRTDMRVGIITICFEGDCDGIPQSFVLDGSPENEGYIVDGRQNNFERGGWAFQICDIDGCSGGFEPVATSTATTTATTTPPTATSTGASSVLFLPGIMGSRLYEDADGCNTTGEGQQRWVSLAVCDQLRLMMSPTGNAVNDIYTKSGQSSILVSQVYNTFFENLSDWKASNIIKDYIAVPYDWRLGLDNLLKAKEDEATGKIKIPLNSTVQEGYLYKTLEKLASESKSGKVTIVAHSNGGLLAKALLATLDRDNDPLLQKVDVLIMVASPQLGTPDALVGMLHGSRLLPYLVVGNVVSQKTSRQLLGTMPFAYHLLPSAQYFNDSGVTVNTPVLTFDAGSLTTPWANSYGSTVNFSQNMQAFMQAGSGRVVPTIDNLDIPAVVSGSQFFYSNSIHLLMNAWLPASTTKVYEIAGTGIKTASGIRYYTGRECGLWNPLCVLFNPKVLYQVNHTVDGDGTVVVPSALGMSVSNLNVERKWLNLAAYNIKNDTENNHASIFDVLEISSFVKDTLLLATSTNYQFITETAPNITDGDRLDFYLHSPLDMTLKLSNGKEISSSTAVVDGGIYRRYGELQYISIPNTPSNKSLVLKGVATGSFTLEIEEYKNGSTTKRQTYSAIPSSTSTKVTVSLTDSSSMTNIVLAVDYDGNGSVDASYNTIGLVIAYIDLKNAINALNISSIYKNILLETAKISEQNYQKSLTNTQFKKVERLTLNVLKQQIIVFGKLRIISVVDQQKLVTIIDYLLNK